MSGISLEPVGRMAMVCLFRCTFNSRLSEALPWRDWLGIGGIKEAQDFSARSFLECEISCDWLRPC